MPRPPPDFSRIWLHIFRTLQNSTSRKWRSKPCQREYSPFLNEKLFSKPVYFWPEVGFARRFLIEDLLIVLSKRIIEFEFYWDKIKWMLNGSLVYSSLSLRFVIILIYMKFHKNVNVLRFIICKLLLVYFITFIIMHYLRYWTMTLGIQFPLCHLLKSTCRNSNNFKSNSST